MAAGKLDERRVREAAEVLLEHRRNELPNVSGSRRACWMSHERRWRRGAVLPCSPPVR
jgi:hypothetical protein